MQAYLKEILLLSIAIGFVFFFVYTRIPLTATYQPYRPVPGRPSYKGEWLTQKVPFALAAYSAFYDNRWSLHSKGPRLVVILKTAKVINRCIVWFSLDQNSSAEFKASAIQNDMLFCQLQHHENGSSYHRLTVPQYVSLGWLVDNVTGRTEFKIPVEPVQKLASESGELLRNPKPTKKLAVCLVNLHGTVDPRAMVEWIEIHRLLGVDHISVYNRDVSRKALDVLKHYARKQGDGFVELRQSASSVLNNYGPYNQQVSLINDCMYRMAGEFRYIAVYDVDEIIVPRQPNVSVVDVLQTLASNTSTLVHAFIFRNVYFYLDDKPVTWNVSENSLKGRPLPKSLYLSMRRRSKVWRKYFVVKTIIDADACSIMSVHICALYTPAFATNGTEIDVPADQGFKHHYRWCNLDSWGAGNCAHEKATSTVDDVLLRYANNLTERLYGMYEQLNLTQLP